MKSIRGIGAAVVAAFGLAGCTPSVALTPDPSSPQPSMPPASVTAAASGLTCIEGVPQRLAPLVCDDLRDAVQVSFVTVNREGYPDATYYFQTPSGNIRCDWTPAAAEDASAIACAVREHTFVGAPDPKSGDLPWDPSIAILGAEVVLGSHVSDGPVNAETIRDLPKLKYGSTVTDGTLACSSAVDGLTCWNSATRHGFSLSREQQLAW